MALGMRVNGFPGKKASEQCFEKKEIEVSPKCRGRFSAASRPTPEEIGGVNWGHYSTAGITVKRNLTFTSR
jgi:hypothetical protein